MIWVFVYRVLISKWFIIITKCQHWKCILYFWFEGNNRNAPFSTSLLHVPCNQNMVQIKHITSAFFCYYIDYSIKILNIRNFHSQDVFFFHKYISFYSWYEWYYLFSIYFLTFHWIASIGWTLENDLIDRTHSKYVSLSWFSYSFQLIMYRVLTHVYSHDNQEDYNKDE